MTIGVFDSGSGGRNILEVLEWSFPEFDFVYISDTKNLPYGLKSAELIRELVSKAVKPLVEKCSVVIIACNTATTAAIEHLRAEFPSTKFIGLEPMLKPAARLTQTGAICVCATPATLRSRNYSQLKHKYTRELKVIEPDCADWAGLIERGETDKINLETLREIIRVSSCDVLVLGCTHYHVLKTRLQKLLPKIKILEPSDAIVEQLKNLL
ncbi:MAG: aspartate/glutamate racemase family protein [Candidatus Nomurabacteria bacterium]|jgi:glutamate racemase|nr:aspartate/glutamate racemase family protein [Candidatus Nomurabacteria bacterium]